MKSVEALRNELYRQLYLSERARREGIRSSISIPTAAIAFAVFALSTLAREFDLSRWNEPASTAIIIFALSAAMLLCGAALNVIRTEWLFVYLEPPDLAELVQAEEGARAQMERDGSGNPEDAVLHDVVRMLTASYYISYQKYFSGNEMSARHRAWAVRLVLLALLCLTVCFVLLPFHLMASR